MILMQSPEEWKATRNLAKSPVVVAQTEVTKPIPSSDDKLETKEPKIDKKVAEWVRLLKNGKKIKLKHYPR